MRTKILIPAVIILFLAFVFLFWHQRQKSLPSSATLEVTQTNSGISTAGATQKNNNASQVVTMSPTSSTVTLSPRDNANEIRQYMESQNVPVAFYGKVIDQDGNPISGARVQGEVLHVKVMVPAPFGAADELIPIDQTTDVEGQFEIQNVSGRSFHLESIQKSGYEVEPDNCPHDFAPAGETSDNPMIFKMWSTNIHEKLITGNYAFQIVPDGRPYFINLTEGTISESSPGDLKVWIQYTNHVVPGQMSDWSAGIGVINGGLQDAPDYAMWMAPADGYVPSFADAGQIRGGQRGQIEERRFYLQLQNGNEYGHMNINLLAPYNVGIPGMVRLSYAINPSGSRILR